MRPSVIALIPALLTPFVSCGGRLGESSSDSSGPGTSSDGGLDGGKIDSSDAGADVGWTPCAAPSGVSICGGPADCPLTAACGECLPGPFSPGDVVPCVLSLSTDVCLAPVDGDICIDVQGVWLGAKYDEGVLFAMNGAGAMARYADFGLWSGATLPVPSDCPSVTGFQLCGPQCGSCPTGRVCTGRSPLHPYGICGQDYRCGTGYGGCPAEQSCFTYVVQPEAQAVADAWGFCLPTTECQSAAARYPGGAKCN